MKRKKVVIITAVIMVLTLAACGNVGADPGESTQVMAEAESTVPDETPEPEATAEPSAKPTESPDASAAPTEESTMERLDGEVGSASKTAQELADKAAADKAAKAEADKQAAEDAAAKAKADKEAAEAAAAAAAQAEADRQAAEAAAAQEAANQQASQQQSQQNQNQSQSNNQSQGNNGSQTQPPAQGNGTADVKDTTPVVPENTPAPHEHSWTPVYEDKTVTVVIQEEWFEPEYADIPIVEWGVECNTCGKRFPYQHSYDKHPAECDSSGSHSYEETIGYDHVDLGSVIRHPAVTETRTEQTLVGYICSCGATK